MGFILFNSSKSAEELTFANIDLIITFILWYHKYMGDDAKILNQNVPPVAQGDQAQPQTVVQPVVPVGSVNKEAGPVVVPDSEFIRPADAEPQIDQELKESGVEVKSDKPNLTSEHKDLIDHSGSSVPVSTTPSKSIQYPMSEKEIEDKLKTGPADDSGKWLAGLIKKIIKAIGF